MGIFSVAYVFVRQRAMDKDAVLDLGLTLLCSVGALSVGPFSVLFLSDVLCVGCAVLAL